jgi:tetratricopeptide (TPR) repeat protein
MARANRASLILTLLTLLCSGIAVPAAAAAPGSAEAASIRVCIWNLKNLSSSEEGYWLGSFIIDGIEKDMGVFPEIILSRGKADAAEQGEACSPDTDYVVYGDFRKTDGSVAVGLKCSAQEPGALPKQFLSISSLSTLRSDIADASQWLADILGVSGGQGNRLEIEVPAPIAPEAIEFYGKALASPENSSERGLWLRRALAEAPGYTDVLYESGIYNYKAGNPDRALVAFEWVLELNPDYPHVHYNLGLANRALGRHSIAVQMYLEALDRNPRDAGAWNNLGVAYHEAEMSDAAAGAFGRALALDPKNPDILKNLEAAGRARIKTLMKHVDAGAAFYLNGEYYRAEESFNHALAIDPGNFKANNNIAMTFEKLGQPAKARVHFELALKSNPAAEEIKRSIAKLPPDALISPADRVEFESPVEVLIPAGVGDPAGVSDSAPVAAPEDEDGKKTAGPDIGLDEELSDSPMKAPALEAAGRIYLSRGSYARAVDAFERALRENPDVIAAIIGLGSAFVGTGEYAEARLQFSRALDLEPDNEIAKAHMAGIEYIVEPSSKIVSGSGGEAVSAADSLLRMEARACLVRGNMQWTQGRYTEALAEYLRSLDFDPVSTEALNNLAAAYYRVGNRESARANLKKARLLDPSSGLISRNINTLDSRAEGEEAAKLEIFAPGF